MGELITVLSREGNRVTHDEIITEIADVRIMIDQLAIIFGKVDVDNEVERKLKRLKKRLDAL